MAQYIGLLRFYWQKQTVCYRSYWLCKVVRVVAIGLAVGRIQLVEAWLCLRQGKLWLSGK